MICTWVTFAGLVKTVRNLGGKSGFERSIIREASRASAIFSVRLLGYPLNLTLFSSTMALSNAVLLVWRSLSPSRINQKGPVIFFGICISIFVCFLIIVKCCRVAAQYTNAYSVTLDGVQCLRAIVFIDAAELLFSSK